MSGSDDLPAPRGGQLPPTKSAASPLPPSPGGSPRNSGPEIILPNQPNRSNGRSAEHAGNGATQNSGRGAMLGLGMVACLLLGGILVAVLDRDPSPSPPSTIPEPTTTTIPEPTTTTIPISTTTTTSTSSTTLPAAVNGPFGDPELLRGRVVVMIWSDFAAPDSDAQIRSHLATYTGQLSLSLVGVRGEWFQSLRDGTVGVVYDGGFPSVVAAAQWCVANNLQGSDGLSCFGVELSDRFSPNDKGPSGGRMYPAAL